MSTTLSISPETKAAIEQCKQTLLMTKRRLETTFSFVPDDKLTYTPSATAKSCLQIAAHTALSNHFFASIIRQDPPSDLSREEILEMAAKKEAEIVTREQALAALEESTAVVVAALDALDDSTIGVEVPTPFMTAPMMFWMYLPARHIDGHASQIDYIQTIWGDLVWHMG